MKTYQESEVFEYSYTGSYQIKNGKKYIMYNDGFEKCLLTSDEKIVCLRRYSSDSVMIFEKDTEHITSYVTPMGSMPLSVVAKDVSDKLYNDKTLSVRYLISVGNTEPVENIINIKIEEI